ncbi:putative mediator of RNA polymerase II transcription subunit 26 isoform X2 [Adelges cooleyi]|uniref:putative mediator of RNA polymerase II transcription subunit 26 isoform X2 n=1 Tax=Adelges cooleyi TaxID=133065 RepID=UPI00218077FE|nr:putative mediator of RNA polymerase II transcription subunit 26 isoform X2 [Adelges cooleyi]
MSTEYTTGNMIHIKTLVVLSLVVFAASVDNNEPDEKDDMAVITPRGIQANRGYDNRNAYSYSNNNNNPQGYNYQYRYQNRGRPFTMPPQPVYNSNRMNYGNVMDQYGNINSYNNGYNNKATIGGQDYSGVGKQGLGVEFTDDGTLVNGKRAPEYDVGNQRLNVDMTGDGFKINGQEVIG